MQNNTLLDLVDFKILCYAANGEKCNAAIVNKCVYLRFEGETDDSNLFTLDI